VSSLRIALIACANGLGHVRRMLSLSLALRAQGASPVLLAPIDAAQRLAMASDVPMPEVIDFKSRTTRADWLEPKAACWIDDLPRLDEFDHVVSDNLIEILALLPSAWLSGSFFWHMALPDMPSEKAARAEELLALYRPRMITTGLFAAPYLAAKTRLNKVGMYSLGSVVRVDGYNDLLISCGKGGEVEKEMREFLNKIAFGSRPGHSMVWVEPGLYCPDMPDWMQPASFTPAMYGRLAAAIIRPGVGTVTDALLAGVRLFMFYESGNLEMIYNARKITEAGLGEAFPSAEHAWWAGLKFLRNDNAQQQHATSLRALDFSGSTEAARLLLMTDKF